MNNEQNWMVIALALLVLLNIRLVFKHIANGNRIKKNWERIKRLKGRNNE